MRFRFSKLCFLGIILLFSQGCNHESERSATLRNVILVPVSTLSTEGTTTYPGVVEEGANISASFMADGKIGRILVKEGDRVGRGQLLAQLDDSDYRIGVAQLEAQFNQMTKEKERMDAMFEKHNIAPNDYEKFSAGYEQLKLQLDMAKRKLDYTRLYSPSSGYIASKYLNEGELAGAGTPVFNIIDDSRLMAGVDLPVGVYLEKNRITGARGSVPGIEGSFPLSILSFTPDADNNMLYHMKLSIPAATARELTPGMNIAVSLQTSENNGGETLIPSRSVFSQSGQTYVWIFNDRDSTIRKKPVVIVGSPSGRMSAVKGLEDDDKVVETGVKQLYEGEKVNVLNRQEIGL